MSSHKIRMGKRLLGFAGLSLTSVVGPLLVLPIVARLCTPADWAALGVGQSVGAVCAVVVTFGWGLVGPVRVARADPDARAALYRESLAVRGALLLVTLPAGVAITWFLAPIEARPLALTMLVNVVLSGLSPAWFCVGAGRPSWIAIYEVVPRLTATALSLAAVLLTKSVILYPALIAAGGVVGMAAFSWRYRPKDGERWPGIGRILRSLRRDGVSAATVVTAAAYSSTPVAIASTVLAVGPLAVFISAERMYRFGLIAITTLSDSVQGWVSEARGAVARRRACLAVAAHALLGVTGLLVIVIFGPWASRVLFGEQLSVGRLTFIGFGISFLAISLNTSLGRHVLVPLQKSRLILLSTGIGAAAGIPSILVLGHLFGAPGAAAAFAISETAVTCVQAVGCLVVYLSRRESAARSPAGALPAPQQTGS